MRSPILAPGSSESESSQVFSSPSRKKDSLADRVNRTRRHRASWQPPSPGAGDDALESHRQSLALTENQNRKSTRPEPAQTNTECNTSMHTENRHDKVDSPKRKTIALAHAHHRKSVGSTNASAPDAKEEPILKSNPATSSSASSLNEKRMRAFARVNKSPTKSSPVPPILKSKILPDESAPKKNVVKSVHTHAVVVQPDKNVAKSVHTHAVVVQPDKNAGKSAHAHAVVVQPEVDVLSHKFASRYGQAASFSKNIAVAVAVESQPPVADPFPRYKTFTGGSTSAPKLSSADRYRTTKADSAPAEEKKEEVEERKPEAAAPKLYRAEIEKPDKVSVASRKNRYGVPSSKQKEPLEQQQPKVQDVPAVKPSGYKASNAFQPTEKPSTQHPGPTTQKPDPSVIPFHRRNHSQGEPSVVTKPEPVERAAAWKPRSSTPNMRSGAGGEPRDQVVSSRRGHGQLEQVEQAHPETNPNASIETPDKVSVSNMKAKFSPGGKPSEKTRAISAPRPMMTGRYHPPTKTSETAQSKNVEAMFLRNGEQANRGDAPPRPKVQEYSKPISKVSPMKKVPVDRHEEMSAEESRAVIETPEKVSVSSMKGKFNTQGTPSFYRSKTPHNTPATPPQTVRPGVDAATPYGPSPPQRAVSNSAPTTTQSWKGRSPSPNRARKEETPSWMKPTLGGVSQRSPSPLQLRHASPLPPASHRTPSRRSSDQHKAAHIAKDIASPPLWKRPDVAQETAAHSDFQVEPRQTDEPPSDQNAVSPEPEATEAPLTPPKSRRDRPSSVEVPQSPRDRPSSIPKWDNSTQPASPSSPSKRPSNIPTPSSPSRRAADASPAEPDASTDAKPDLEIIDPNQIIDPNPVRETIESIPRSPSSPSPRNRERPWKRDLQTLSPRSWDRRWASSGDVEGDYHQLKALYLPHPSSMLQEGALGDSRTSTPVLQNYAGADMRQQKTAPVDRESYGEEKKTCSMEDELPLASVGSMMSLTQMAANSIHAVDYEQAMSGMVKSSDSYDDEESNISGGTGGTGGAIPVDLPPDLARAIAQDKVCEVKAVPRDQRDKASSEVHELISQAKASLAKNISREKLAKASSEANQALGVDAPGHNIIFGDPNTYGAAGSDAGEAPPRVADRAKAIANWKGGLGVVPPPAPKFDRIYDMAPSESPREHAQIEESHSDVVFGNPQTYGAAGGEFLNDSPRVVERTHAIEEWATSPSKSSGSRESRSSPRSLGAMDHKTPAGVKSTGLKGSKSPAGGGSSAVKNFWATTSKDELDDAHNWTDKDPMLEDIGAADETGDVTPEELENQLLGLHGNERGFMKNWPTRTAGHSPPRVNSLAPDPFAFDAVAALSKSRSATSSEIKSKTMNNAFDPFLDGVTESLANFGGSTNFFSEPSKVFAPEEEFFSPPTFTPRANEESLPHDFDQGAAGLTYEGLALAPPSRSSSEDSDPVTGQQVFSNYSKIGLSRRQRRSVEIDQMKKQRKTVTEKPKERKTTTETTGVSRVHMSVESEQSKERTMTVTVKSKERKTLTETALDPANMSESLEADPWSYDADAEPNASGFDLNASGFDANTSASGFDLSASGFDLSASGFDPNNSDFDPNTSTGGLSTGFEI